MTNELLNMEELDLVAGGTIAEMTELIDAMEKNPYVKTVLKFGSHVPVANEFLKQDVAGALFKMGIDADISIGFCGTGLMSDPNKYRDVNNGYKTMTHAQVLERIKSFVG